MPKDPIEVRRELLESSGFNESMNLLADHIKWLQVVAQIKTPDWHSGIDFSQVPKFRKLTDLQYDLRRWEIEFLNGQLDVEKFGKNCVDSCNKAKENPLLKWDKTEIPGSRLSDRRHETFDSIIDAIGKAVNTIANFFRSKENQVEFTPRETKSTKTVNELSAVCNAFKGKLHDTVEDIQKGEALKSKKDDVSDNVDESSNTPSNN